MKSQISPFFYNIIIIILISNFISILNQISSIFPVKKILLSQELTKLDSITNIKRDLGSKGYGIIFNYNSNISLIPYYLFNQIVEYYKSFEDIVMEPINTQNEFLEIVIYAYIKDYEYLHFILENMDISIPLKYYLTEKKKNSQKYGMRFLSRQDQEYIVFGKDLIDLMEIEFKGQNNFIIHNSEFISTFGDNE